MDERYSRLVLPVTLLSGCLLAVGVAVCRPGYLSSGRYLGALIFLQVAVAAIWNYRQRFFVLLLAVFLWAGMALPLRDAWASGRWAVLIVGAMVGFVLYLKDRAHHFGGFHLIGFFCVLAALISAMVSAFPEQAVLKALSLLLLFLYASSGARLTVLGRESKFFNGLLLGCEALAYLSAVSYLGLRFEVFGNPNSLGAVMGVVVVPILLWGVMVAEGVLLQRRALAWLIAVFLLLASHARAGIAGGILGCLVLCLGLRRYRLLFKGVGVTLLLAVLVITIAPLPEEAEGSLASSFVYKGHREEGVLGSRLSVWQRASDDIQQHPWFGTGFGTSATLAESDDHALGYRSSAVAIREHGNSYLAIVEWVGLLGVLPFAALVVLVAGKVVRVLAWMRRTRNACSPAVPIAAVLAAGLLHAAFEDWLFAVGYYLCIFFWSCAFVFMDVAPRTTPELAASRAPQPPGGWPGRVGLALPQP
jgi:O-antigen ligase